MIDECFLSANIKAIYSLRLCSFTNKLYFSFLSRAEECFQD